MMNLRALRSGSDVRGKALGEGSVLTPNVAARIGAALVGYLQDKTSLTNPRISIGRDPRLTGEDLLNACAQGMRDAGANVWDFELCTTPAMFMSLLAPDFGGDAAVMITASHQGPEKNGIKIFLPSGCFSPEQMDEVLALAESDRAFSMGGGSIEKRAFLPEYCNMLKDRLRKGMSTDVAKPLLGLHVLVDAGNGSGGFYARILEDLGAWVEGSQFLEPDGRFPNHIPNPENEENMASLSAAVIRYGADMGVTFDADCDRAALVDDKGRAVNRNRLIALVSAVLLDKESGLTIVTDSVTSFGLQKFIGEWGGIQYRYKRGYQNVIEEAKRLNESGVNCPLAIETSGHAALRENHFLDDGMYLVTMLIAEAMLLKQEGKALGSLISDLKEPLERVEMRLNITAPDFRTAGKKVIEKVMDYAFNQPEWHIAQDNREGVRINFSPDGNVDSAWALLRLSVHDPVLPLNMESDVKGGSLHMARALKEVLADTEDVDPSPLNEFIKKQEEKK